MEFLAFLLRINVQSMIMIKSIVDRWDQLKPLVNQQVLFRVLERRFSTYLRYLYLGEVGQAVSGLRSRK